MADDRIDLEGWTLDELMQESGPMDTLASIVEDYDIDWTGREDDVDDDVEDDDDESAIIDEIEQVLTEDDEGPSLGVTSFGRVSMANRVRDARAGKLSESDGYGEGYKQGVTDALKFAGVSEREAEAAYSGLFSAIGKGIFALGKHVVVPALSGASGLEQGAGVQDLAYRAGSGVREGIDPEAAAGDDAIVADAMQAPPVYVADDIGAHEGAMAAQDELGSGLDRFEGLKGSSRFSASVTTPHGFIGRQPSRSAKKAVDRSLKSGRSALLAVDPAEGASMVRDPGAQPIVYSSGKIVDEVHGALHPVPCPSCSRVEYGSITKGAGKSCLVCDGNGSILVPKTDLPEYKGCVRYGAIFLPLLISAVSSAAGPVLKGKFPEASKRFSEWKAEKTGDIKEWVAERRDDPEEKEAMGALDRTCVVGAIVPLSRVEMIASALEERELESMAALVEAADELDEQDEELDELDEQEEEDYDDLEDLQDLDLDLEGQE